MMLPSAPKAHEAPVIQETWTNPNGMTRAEREEMKVLSKEIFGNVSKWKSILEKGYMEKVTKTVIEQVPQEDGTTKPVEKKMAVLNEHGAEYSVQKYYSVEKLKEKMLDMKAQIAENRAKLEKLQADAAKEKAAKDTALKIQESAGGSAI